jgi:hypothetical protein
MNLNFLDEVSKNAPMSNFMKIFSVGAKLFHANRRTDRETDMTKLIVAFRNFASPPKNFSLDEFMQISLPQGDVS